MLVCPKCESENPDDGKFCQKCGTSLLRKACPACGTLVAFDVEHCPTCGEATGTVWRAIVSFNGKLTESPAMPDATPANPQFPESVQSSVGAYLDPQQRYKLLDSLLAPDSSSEVEVRVLDCQPFQASIVEAFEEYTYEASQPPDDLEQSSPSEWISSQTNALLAIPALAKTYLELQHCCPALPHIHDAWEQNGQTVVLLQDRSELMPLLEFWSSEQILPLQILHWLHEMTELWGILQTQGCAQSLLEPSNLRVDEDHLLCLQRLYFDQPEQPLKLRDLGNLWQQLFQDSQRTQLGALAQLYCDLETEAISTLEQLQSRLEAIADEFQSEPVPTMPSLDASNTARIAAEATAPTEAARSASATTIADKNPASVPLLELGDPEEDFVSEGDDTPTVVLPMKLISLEEMGRTDIGRQRDHNEDYFSIQTDLKKLETPSGRSLQAKGIYILCDGMGGHAGGEVASALAVDTLRQYFETHWQEQLPKEESIREAIQLANQAIYDLNQQNGQSGSGRMGTTLVLVLVHNTDAAIAHVGDSRLYRFSRRRGLEQVTVDHEVGQREIQRGVEPSIAYARPDAYQLTQALGPRDENFISPDIEFLELSEDLLLLLCSDGLTDNDLLETHWRTHIEPLLSSQSSLEQGVNQLIDLANQQNGHDNITAVLIRAKVRPNLELLKQQ